MSVQLGGYPSLATISSLMRVFLNDWQQSGAGIISTDDPTVSPQTLPALNSAIREVYRELRNVGAPRLIRDNVLVNLPVNAVNGPGIQTYLSFTGYYNGSTLLVSPVLPPDMQQPLELWEQQTNSSLPFIPMTQPQFGLPSIQQQTFALGYWEWREDQLNFLGALCPITIRIRYYAALSTFVTPVDYATTFIPILDCEEAVAYKAAYKIASALEGVNANPADLKTNAAEAMMQLKNAIVRRAQSIEYSRQPYGSNDSTSGTTNSVNSL